MNMHSSELLLCAILLTWILRQYSSRPALVYLAGIMLLLTPDFTLTYFKLLYVEKNTLFLLSAFVAAYLLFLRRQQTVYFVLSLLCANAVVYYKEPVFAVIAVLPLVICCCGKILGAGGSGFMLFYVRPERQASVKEQLRRLIHVPFHFENSGSRIVLYQPNGLT
jgi:hypothetical protein